VKNIASISLDRGLINQTSVPHLIVNGFKNLASIGLEAGIKLKQLENLGTGSGAGAKASAPAKDAPKEKAKEPEKKKEEPKVEEDVGLGGDLFGDF